MVPFADYELPVQYKSIVAEAKACRARAGMFDVSHMARLRFSGDRVLDYLEHMTTNDVADLGDAQGHYSLLPNSGGGVVDDIILYRITATEFRMIVNAANHEKDVDWLRQHNDYGLQIEDKTDETAMIAVQGPNAVEIVASLSTKATELSNLPFFGNTMANFAGVDCFAARSGYTGEDGFELVCAASDALTLWSALAEKGVEPCGLGSRDVLRVEAGLPLYGHELNDEMSPLEAGLGWVISKKKEFLGSSAMAKIRENGVTRKLHGIQMEGKRLPNPEMTVLTDQGPVGVVSSGVFSPLLDCGIGFAFVRADVPIGTTVYLDIRGKMEPGRIVSKRFFKRDK